MNKYTIYFLLSLITISCSDKNDVPVEELQLSGIAIDIDSSSIFRQPQIILGDNVITMETFGKKNGQVGFLKDNKLGKTDSLFEVGKGHNEFTYIKFAKGVDNSLLLLDGTIRSFSMTVIPNAQNIDSLKNKSNWKRYSLKNMESVLTQGSNFYTMSDSTILMCATPDKYYGHIMSIIDYKNQTCQPLDFWPDDGIEIDSLVKCRVYTGNSEIYGNGKSRYLYNLYNDGLYTFIFSIDNNKVNVVKDLYTKYPIYKTANHMDIIRESIIPEKITCEASDKYIYLMHLDSDKEGNKIDKDVRRHQTLNSNTIDVYDWDGNLLKRLKLDHYGARLMLSDDNSILYLLTDSYWDGDVNPQIWSYDLTGIE